MQKTNKNQKIHKKLSKRKGEFELAGDAQVYSYLTVQPRASPAVRTEQRISIQQSFIVPGFITTSTSIPVYATRQFQFSDIDQYAALAAVFDQYMINSIELYLTVENSNSNISNTGKLSTVLDYDDGTALASVGQALDYSNCLTSSHQSNQYRRFVPHLAVAAYSGSAFSQFKNEIGGWIDTSSPNVLHYGLKCASTTTSVVMTMDLTVRYHISLRCVR
jgi:hypothetical protein